MSFAHVSISAFIIAIGIGIYLVLLGVRHRRRSPALGLLHAVLVLAGTALLFAEIITGPADKLNNLAALLLLLALLGGALLFALREDSRPPSMPLVVTHAIIGVAGVSLLLVNALG